MKLFFNRVNIAVVAALLTTLISCQKENETSNTTTVNEEEATAYADESAQAEASFNDVQDISMMAADEESVVSAPNGRNFLFEELRLRLGACVNITVFPDDGTYPKTITIDFGDGCLCADGKFRKGAIILHLTGPIRRSGSVLTVTFRNFFLNHAHIEGTKIISNLSANGNIRFTIQVVGGKVTFPTGRGYAYNALKYVKQIEGGSTLIIRDDVYSIEGSSETRFNNGLIIKLHTETPLIKKVVCHWVSNGVLKIQIMDRVLFLDYGAPNNGDCDNKALLTWNNGNNHRLITLP